MSENKRTWNDKIKLILNELESKINEENTRKTQRRQTGAGKGKQSLNKLQENREDESANPTFRQETIMRVVMSVAFLLATAALVRGVIRVMPGAGYLDRHT